MVHHIRPTGRVHWIGTGMSTGSGLAIVCENASVTLWGRSTDKAEACLARLGLRGKAEVRAYRTQALASELAAGDTVVSMLPAAEHPGLLELALRHEAHFVCSSYTSPLIAEQADEARRRGLVILTEIGLDPGIDHLLAHELVRKARQVTGDRPATVDFTSYCGSNPAVPNEFRYQFNWAPRGVLTALLTPARMIAGSAPVTVARPWEAVATQAVGGETFEVYPNRDSIPFLTTYRFPAEWDVRTFVRGTMRLDGWSAAWKPVFDELDGITDARIDELAEELAARCPTTPTDRDRVVMAVRLRVRTESGSEWCGEYRLDAVGDERESATPRLVSVPLAGGVLAVTHGRVAPGLQQATDRPDQVREWLAFLDRHAVSVTYHEEVA
ncbi:saccharopine dehydrogenase family protein [Streptomyces anulatus]|uniref:saccharopine dehydrogenase family protein n=1 Tax=Streptomyces anulatus TaxID=1892 RepID=UPI0036F6B2CB